MIERETIQEVLAAYFRDESLWRQHQSERPSLSLDRRYRTACEWLAELAAWVKRLPDNDPGIKTLGSFGWPPSCFRHGTGSDAAHALRHIGFDGTRTKPLVDRPDNRDLARAWSFWVTAAERDARSIARMLGILVELLEDTPRSRLQAALGRLGRKPDDTWPA